METLWDMSILIIRFLQSLGDWLTAPMRFLSFLGRAEFYMLFMPALYWCWDAGLGLRIGLVLMLSSGLNGALKIAFRQPRPYWVSQQIAALSSETSFGLPSGHAQNAVSVWGLLAALWRRRWTWGAALALAFLIGLSRLYLAVHFPSDVLVGWLVGAIILWAFLRWEAPVGDWLKRRSLGGQTLIAFVASLVLLLLTLLASASLESWQVPESWVQNALAITGEAPDPLSLGGALQIAGTIFGMGAGAAWLHHAGGFRADGPAWKRLVRYLVGLIGVFLLWYGLGAIFPRHEDWVSYSLRYLRYALVGAWVMAGAPALFLRLKLSERALSS